MDLAAPSSKRNLHRTVFLNSCSVRMLVLEELTWMLPNFKTLSCKIHLKFQLIIRHFTRRILMPRLRT